LRATSRHRLANDPCAIGAPTQSRATLDGTDGEHPSAKDRPAHA
jgi:hypothetical protein